MDVSPPGFADVDALLEASRPRPRGGFPRFGAGIFLVLILSAGLLASKSGVAERSITALYGALAVVWFGTMSMLTGSAARAHRAEQQQLQAAEELVQLRRWPDADVLLRGLLSRPTRTASSRAQALILLSAVLARYHRFEEAAAIQGAILEEGGLDGSTAYGIRLGRAMSLLREDLLYEADRAIADLRRDRRGTDLAPADAAALSLVEIYRDVKTGHPDDALKMFDDRLPQLREYLGHRVADAWALAARAHDLLNHPTEAAAAYENATLLAPEGELHRRYPEVAALAGNYPPSPAPPEVE